MRLISWRTVNGTADFLAVHAHPDDEASSSGGLYRLLADQGVRTVLVTCTNGECGDALDGAKPDAIIMTATKSPRFVRSNSTMR